MKTKKCRTCKAEFNPFTTTQTACSVPCAVKQVETKRVTEWNAETRRRKQGIKTKSTWLREAQAEFNGYIRTRDKMAGHGCISCTENIKDQFMGGSYDAGHYISRGAAPEKRFLEDNVFQQCKKCNRQLSGNVANMRLGIIKRIGLERLEAVEAYHEPLRLTIEDIKAIKDKYKKMKKELQRE